MKTRGHTIITSADVMHTIMDMHQANPPLHATKKAIAQELDVSYRLIDEHVDRLIKAGKIRRILPGVFAPVESQKDKIISSTHVPGGRIKLDVDDVCLDLSIRDVRAIVYVLAGFAMVPFTQVGK